MKIKALLITALITVAFIGIYAAETEAAVNATLIPSVKYNVTQKDKDRTGKDEGETTVNWNVAPILGVSGTNGKTSAEASIMLSFAEGGAWFGTGFANMTYIGANSCIAFSGTVTHDFDNGLQIKAGSTGTGEGAYAWENAANDAWFLFFVPNPGAAPLLKFTFKGAWLAFIRPSTASFQFAQMTPASTSVPADLQKDKMLPRIAVGYSKFMAPHSFGFNANYETYKIKDKQGTVYDGKSRTAYGAFANFSTTVADIGIAVAGFYVVNYGDINVGGAPFGRGVSTASLPSTTAAGEVQDTAVMGGFLTLAYSVTPDARASAGICYEIGTNDDPSYKENEVAMEYYVSLKYNLAPTYFLTPSVQINDGTKINGDPKGMEMVFNVQFGAVL